MSPGEPAHQAALQGWPELAGYDPAPPLLDAAQAAFARGVEAFGRGEQAEARAEFLRAEALLPEAAGDEWVASLDELRRIARENAAVSGSVAEA